jgi:hypothetical protein
MTRPAVFAAVVLALVAVPVAAAAPTSASVAAEALDLFCKPFLAGSTSSVDVRTRAKAAGWTEYGGMGHMTKGGDWGGANANFRVMDSCTVTIPVGRAKGKEVSIVDAAGAWARKNGYSLKAPRAKTAGPGPAPGIYDILAEDWVRPDGRFPMEVRAYINRRKEGMSIPDVSIMLTRP